MGQFSIPAQWPQNVQFGWASTDAMNARWISPQADVVAIPGVPENVYYVYSTSFDLSGLDPDSAELQGIWAADNYITQVTLNGVPIYTNTSIAGVGAGTCFSFQNPTPFDITNGFTNGVNTLSFYVTNDTCYNTPPDTNPTGLLVDFGLATADTQSTVPEPGTIVLTGAGLALATALARRRRS
jgi:hypothetical protein